LPFIEVEAAEKIYRLGDTEIHALRGVTLSLGEREFVAVWGPSGSGKSTLCHLLGVIDHPTRGRIVFDGEDVAALPDNRKSELRNHKVGFVFQSFNLVPVLSAVENVMLPLEMQGISQRQARQRAEEMLDRVGLAGSMNHWPKKLSGGQRQRVAIARGLVTHPRVIIADEPTANLDSQNAQNIIDLMRELNRSSGTSFIFSTHDERLMAHVDRKIHLQDGLITEDLRLTPTSAGAAVTVPPAP
jgi:putative ABC transport system ATP-binding protein